MRYNNGKLLGTAHDSAQSPPAALVIGCLVVRPLPRPELYGHLVQTLRSRLELCPWDVAASHWAQLLPAGLIPGRAPPLRLRTSQLLQTSPALTGGGRHHSGEVLGVGHQGY
ncbi:hypothetical protein NDU88_008466 [Pleurodeles waltl]|uniref:Uncharacterized protein n=1 Tax=Pleurodeles waltl TaxID=8319 RepID=A0AAV7QNT6_PLEWA|nr:hypothetical protein NDU88_008466 [Pleurodeles waltl]